MTTADATSIHGTFEYIEAKIRRDSEGTAFGGDFEWLCRWFLENAPRYRGQFDKVWLWKDWPDRWGTDAGIDIVALTRTGELWAIQAKADHPDRAIPKREIDSFLSESNRPQFAYRLLMATTDAIGSTARRTLHGQENPVGLVLRGHFLTEEIQWPVQIGASAAPLPRWDPKRHQTTAIQAVVNGFEHQDRGRLIMACGTGKTLTALWIAERLQSSLTLVLVPSLSLVQQNLAEWGRHSAEDFDTLVVCSDESVLQSKADTAIQSTADLGVKVTTDSAEIEHFLGQRRKRPAVVFATYQSSDRISAAQAGKRKPFDLVICDEAHRLAGHAEGLFATVLDDRKIKARKRLFMTATPRYFKEHVKRRAAELTGDGWHWQLVSQCSSTWPSASQPTIHPRLALLDGKWHESGALANELPMHPAGPVIGVPRAMPVLSRFHLVARQDTGKASATQSFISATSPNCTTPPVRLLDFRGHRDVRWCRTRLSNYPHHCSFANFINSFSLFSIAARFQSLSRITFLM